MAATQETKTSQHMKQLPGRKTSGDGGVSIGRSPATPQSGAVSATDSDTAANAVPNAEIGMAKRLWYVPIWIGYAGLIFYTILHHEPWFDKAQAWLIARDCSFSQLFSEVLRYEGHPALWYLILKIAITCGLPYEALGLLGGAIATVGIGVFLAKSPLPKLLTALFPFTFFLAYQYAVVARSYVLMPLFLFAVAILARRKWERPIRWVVPLMFLANVSVHAFLVACGILFVHVLELAFRWRRLDGEMQKRRSRPFGCTPRRRPLVVPLLWPMSDCVTTTGLNGGVDFAFLGHTTLIAVDCAFFHYPVLTIGLLLVSCYWFWRTGVLWLFSCGLDPDPRRFLGASGVSSSLRDSLRRVAVCRVAQHGCLCGNARGATPLTNRCDGLGSPCWF